MPAYKPPSTAFGRMLEHEYNKMTIDFAINMNFWHFGEDRATWLERVRGVLDDLIYRTSFWECVPQEIVDVLDILEALCWRECTDCHLLMTMLEKECNKRRCAACEALPYHEWCLLIGRSEPSKDDSD